MRYLGFTGSRLSLTLCVVAAMAVVAVPAAYPANITGDWEERIERQLPFAPGGSLEVLSRNGSVEISSWDKEEIKIVMEKRVSVSHGGTWFARFLGLKTNDIESEEDIQAILDALTVEIIGDENDLKLRTVRPTSAEGLRYREHNEIVLPAEAQVSIEWTNGKIEISDVTGAVSAETTNGGITCEKIRGPMHVETTNGSIRGEDLSGEIKAETTNGSIELRLEAAPGPDDSITCRTVNGSIEVRMPRESSFEIKARSRSSRLSDDFELTNPINVSRRSIEGTVGSGGPKVSLRTTNGRIEIDAI